MKAHLKLIVYMVILGTTPAWAYDFAGGTGQPNDPFQIATAEQLISIGSDPNLLQSHFVLLNDIDLDPNLPGGQVFGRAVIAAPSMEHDRLRTEFSGGFDGKGHTIRHLTVRTPAYTRNLGLFGFITKQAFVQNLRIEDAIVQGARASTVGILAGTCHGRVSNCQISGHVSGEYEIGGVVGLSQEGIIEKTCSEVQVTGHSGLGGLAGHAYAESVELCYSEGSVIGSENSSRVGGLVGYAGGRINRCYASCFVAGGKEVGGLLGHSSASSYYGTKAVTECYATGPVIGIQDLGATGGLIGTARDANSVGGCYYLAAYGSLLADNGIGIPLTEALMRDQSSYSGWDFQGQLDDGFADTWMMPGEGGYPVLSLYQGYEPPSSGGTGTADDPYVISAVDEFTTVLWYPEAYYCLGADIDFAEIPLPDPLIPFFSGHFNGRGHRLLNVTITAAWGGFFGAIEAGAVVENLAFVNANRIAAAQTSSVGMLAGTNNGTVRNCHMTGSVSGTENVGGLIGRNKGVLWLCSGHVTVVGERSIGGLCGSNQGIIDFGYTHGAISGQDHVGGLVGANGSGLIAQCYSVATLVTDQVGGETDPNTDVSQTAHVGALVGTQNQGHVVDSYYLSRPERPALDNGVGTPLSAAQFADSSSFEAWDFEGSGVAGVQNLWRLAPGHYPLFSPKITLGLEARGMSQEEVQDRLIRAGHELGEIRFDYDGTVPAGKVIGIQYETGANPIILVSRGLYAWSENQGDGTAGNPFQIASAGLLDCLGQQVPLWACHFALTEDIDLSGRLYADALIAPDVDETVDDFQGTAFTGSFHGQGHSVSGMTIISSSDYVGLFGLTGETAQIQALHISDALVRGMLRVDRRRCGTGALAGENGGDIVDCHSTGSVLGTLEVGGLVGDNKGLVTQCTSFATVAGTMQVGGLVGLNSGHISMCRTDTRVLARDAVGGVAGENSGDVLHCWAAGAVSGAADCQRIGGLIGDSSGDTRFCFSIGVVNSSIGSGGLIGQNSGALSFCFWDVETSGVSSSSGGFGKTTAQMQQAGTYLGWGNEKWTIEEGNSYPRLVWESPGGQVIDNIPLRTYAGHGDPNDPFLLSSPQDLSCLMFRPEDWRGSFVLTKRIDASSITEFLPLGSFTGHLDGQGHSIENLTISDHLAFTGLIGHLQGGSVNDLHLSHIKVSSSGDYVGTLVGHVSHGEVSRCSTTGYVTVADHCQYIGGLVGRADQGSLRECSASATISAGKDCTYIGGLVGRQEKGSIRDSYATGRITAADPAQWVGGLTGGAYRLNRCYAAVEIWVDQAQYAIGGLAGSLWGWKSGASACFWDVEVSGLSESAGGSGRTTSDMQDMQTYMDAYWDFPGETRNGSDSVWSYPLGADYPKLLTHSGLPETPMLAGTGTEDDPYRIGTTDGLMAVADLDASAHYVLTANIDFSEYAWTRAPLPILRGTFDGAGFGISGLHVSAGSRLGLFGTLDKNATVKNVRIDAMQIANRPGGRYTGLLAGENRGHIIDCHVTGSIFGNVEGQNIGGLVGANSGRIDRSSAETVMTGGGGCQNMGGLAGRSTGFVQACFSRGQVHAEEGASAVGGLIGENTGTVDSCYTHCSVTGDQQIGACVGVNLYTGVVRYGYATGPTVGQTETGGFIGVNTSPNVFSCYWDLDLSDMTPNGVGAGKSTAQMFMGRTYRAWGNTAKWTIKEGTDYPRLRWEQSGGSVLDLPLDRYATGVGTQDNPYQIETADQLVEIAYCPNDFDKHFVLSQDIDLRSMALGEVIPIGSADHPFSGVFEGNGHTVTNLTINAPHSDDVGLFGCLAPDPNAQIDSGLIRSVRLRDVDIWGNNRVGGLVGTNQGWIVSCSVSGSIEGEACVGGLIGVQQSQGETGWSFADCRIQANRHVGGLVGENHKSGRMIGCYAKGTIRGSIAVGGLIGKTDGGLLVNSYSTAAVTADSFLGGCIGFGKMYVHLCYWDLQASGAPTSAGGLGKTTAELGQRETFPGWGFWDIWILEDGKDYPRLYWENAQGTLIVNSPNRYDGGTGEPHDPFRIQNAQQFLSIWKHLDDYDKYFRLERDIDLTEVDVNDVRPIGVIFPFTGCLDGDNHIISGFHYDTTFNQCGLIGSMSPQATVRDLHLVGVNVVGGENVAGLVGNCEGTIQHCTVQGLVTGWHNVGGLIGWLATTGSVTDSSSTIEIRQGDFAGSLIGSCLGSVQSSFGRGSVTGGFSVGGLIGAVHDAVLTDCGCTANVKGTYSVGGLLGQAFTSEIHNCYASGPVAKSQYTGGLRGHNKGSHFTSCFFDEQTTGIHSGTGRKSTQQMYQADTFIDAGWNFDDVWMICEGEGYPRLQWEQVQCSDYTNDSKE